MKVLVSGSRSLLDPRPVWTMLDGLWRDYEVGYMLTTTEPFVVIHGAARGVDTSADNWATQSPLHGPLMDARPDPTRPPPDEGYVLLDPYPADWDRHGKAAGPIRNREMLAASEPDLVIAFVDKPLTRSRGTHDMVTIAREAGITTWVTHAP